MGGGGYNGGGYGSGFALLVVLFYFVNYCRRSVYLLIKKGDKNQRVDFCLLLL